MLLLISVGGVYALKTWFDKSSTNIGQSRPNKRLRKLVGMYFCNDLGGSLKFVSEDSVDIHQDGSTYNVDFDTRPFAGHYSVVPAGKDVTVRIEIIYDGSNIVSTYKMERAGKHLTLWGGNCPMPISVSSEM